jgi:hypothetical protein
MIVQLVEMKNPCQSCIIVSDLMINLFERIKPEYPDVDFVITILERPEDARKVDGLEIDLFPAILIDKEQITAGNILHKRQLKGYIDVRRPNG